MLKYAVALVAALFILGVATPVGGALPPANHGPPAARLVTATPLPAMQQTSDATALQNAYTVNLDAVKHITCAVPKPGKDPKSENPADFDVYSGTGTVISQNRILTASHVIHGAAMCMLIDEDRDLKVSYDDPKLDVAVMTADLGDGPVMPISCDGFRPLAPYMAIGFSLSHDFALDVIGFTGEYHDIPVQADEHGPPKVFSHAALFHGRVFAGMSGGPVIDLSGHVTGIINIGSGDDGSNAGIRDLRETPLCTMLQPPVVVAAAAPATPSEPIKTAH